MRASLLLLLLPLASPLPPLPRPALSPVLPSSAPPTTPLTALPLDALPLDALLVRGGASPRKAPSQPAKKRRAPPSSKRRSSSLSSLADATKAKTLSGKASLSSNKPKARLDDLASKYWAVPKATRAYMTLTILATASSLLLGDELAQSLFALTPGWFPLQPHRLVTAGAYLGAPSVQALMSVYYLFAYGSSLESSYGLATFLLFLSLQVLALACFSTIVSSPFYAQPLITAMLHVVSRQDALANVKWLIFTVPYWTLPYGLMLSDVLQAQSAAAATPHVLGILAGHLWHFFKVIWPAKTGSDWLVAPRWLRARLDEDGADKGGGEARVKRRRGKGVALGDL